MMKIRTDIWINLLKHNGLPEPIPEYKFHTKRKWKVDYAFVEKKLAVEIEGGVWTQGRHIRGSGFIGDIEKYNALTLAGWRLLRFTPEMIQSGEALNTIIDYFVYYS